MPYVFGFLMVLFLVVGIYLVFSGLKDFWLRRQRLAHLARVEGVVLSVTRKQAPNSKDKKKRYEKRHWMFFPVIQFMTPSGASITFESESGDTGVSSKYSPGQRIPVLYDVENQLPPMIDSWWGLWGGAFFQMLGGVALMGGSLLIFTVFGDKILG